jgi:uncharacterized protein
MAIELGRFNTLKIVKEVDFGLYLDGGEEGEILLPRRYMPEHYAAGDELRVFIYLDNEERLVATTLTPYVEVGGFACLEVTWVNRYGAFLDWGLMKDLFCPFREQKQRMEVGRRYVVHAHVDDESFRIMASARIEHFLDKGTPQYEPWQEVDIMVWQRTDLGYKVIVDDKFSGLVFRDEVFRPMHQGLRLKAYVKQVRPDGKIDIALQKSGYENVEDFAQVLLQHLRDNGGHTALGDKSPSQDIYDTFGVSKKVFKKAVGDLYKRHLIIITPDGLQLTRR